MPKKLHHDQSITVTGSSHTWNHSTIYYASRQVEIGAKFVQKQAKELGYTLDVSFGKIEQYGNSQAKQTTVLSWDKTEGHPVQNWLQNRKIKKLIKQNLGR